MIGKKELSLSTTHFSDLVTALKLDYTEAYEFHQAMHSSHGQQVTCTLKDGKHYTGLEEIGMIDYIDQYWLREGQKELNERIYDKTKWIVPVVAVFITLVSTLYSVLAIQSTKEKVANLQEEVKSLQVELHSVPQTKKFHYLFPWYTDTTR